MSFSVENSKTEVLQTENVAENTMVDEETEKKLVRKIDLYLMPSVFVLYLFSYVVCQP